jgi:hypothetical protein
MKKADRGIGRGVVGGGGVESINEGIMGDPPNTSADWTGLNWIGAQWICNIVMTGILHSSYLPGLMSDSLYCTDCTAS